MGSKVGLFQQAQITKSIMTLVGLKWHFLNTQCVLRFIKAAFSQMDFSDSIPRMILFINVAPSRSIFFVLLFFLNSCAYRLGSGPRSIPGGYSSISIPIFKNKSFEPGAEVAFTNSLLEEFHRSKIAEVKDDALSDVRIEGEINSLENIPQSQQAVGEALPYLPKGTILATEYRIVMKVNLRILRRSDDIEVWSGSFMGERKYSASQVTVAGVNSVNSLYDLSARRQNIELLAKDLMSEAHNRITENF